MRQPSISTARVETELDLTDFKGARKDAEETKVDVVIAGDRVQALGLIACAKSCVILPESRTA